MELLLPQQRRPPQLHFSEVERSRERPGIVCSRVLQATRNHKQIANFPRNHGESRFPTQPGRGRKPASRAVPVSFPSSAPKTPHQIQSGVQHCWAGWSHVYTGSRSISSASGEGLRVSPAPAPVGQSRGTPCSGNTSPQDENPGKAASAARRGCSVSASDLNGPMVSQWLKQEAR